MDLQVEDPGGGVSRELGTPESQQYRLRQQGILLRIETLCELTFLSQLATDGKTLLSALTFPVAMHFAAGPGQASKLWGAPGTGDGSVQHEEIQDEKDTKS